MKNIVDTKLRGEQVGFRKNRSCTDQIATLSIIVEQSIEWNSPFLINFIDYEKAFDSVDRVSLWKLLRHYGIPEKRVVHEGQLTNSFPVQTGVIQGCLLSPFLLSLIGS